MTKCSENLMSENVNILHTFNLIIFFNSVRSGNYAYSHIAHTSNLAANAAHVQVHY